MPLKPRRVLVPTMPGPIATTAASASRDRARDGERRVDRHGFEVAAERVTARDGGVDEVELAQRGDEIRHRHGQAGAVGHDVRETSPGMRSLNAAATAGTWLWSAAATTGMPSIDSTSASDSRCSSVLPTSAWRLV